MLIYPVAKIPENKHSHIVMVEIIHTLFQGSKWPIDKKRSFKMFTPFDLGILLLNIILSK